MVADDDGCGDVGAVLRLIPDQARGQSARRIRTVVDRARARGGGRLVLILQDEEITDPHRIPADDPQRGIVWEISVTDLGAS